MHAFSYKKALITGGSSGIGLAIASYLVERGVSTLLIGRDRGRLESARSLLREKALSGAEVSVFSCDISDEIGVHTMREEAVLPDNIPDLLVNCAGTAYPDYFESLPNGEFEKTLSTNVRGTWYVLKELLPLMGRGSHVVNVSSISGFVGTFGYTAYSASKFAIVGLSEALRNELSLRGIGVSVLCPPDTDTPQLSRENLTKPYEAKVISGNAGLMRPEDVARALFSGLKRGRFIIVPGFQGKCIYFLKRIFPGLVFHIIDSDAKKASRRI